MDELFARSNSINYGSECHLFEFPLHSLIDMSKNKIKTNKQTDEQNVVSLSNDGSSE
jgi:hypothetical protein